MKKKLIVCTMGLVLILTGCGKDSSDTGEKSNTDRTTMSFTTVEITTGNTEVASATTENTTAENKTTENETSEEQNIVENDSHRGTYEGKSPEKAPRITIQPKDCTIYEGELTDYYLEAEGDDLKYIWYSDGGNGEDMEISHDGYCYNWLEDSDESDKSDFNIVPYGPGETGRRFCCKVYNEYGWEYSDIVTLTVKEREADQSTATSSQNNDENNEYTNEEDIRYLLAKAVIGKLYNDTGNRDDFIVSQCDFCSCEMEGYNDIYSLFVWVKYSEAEESKYVCAYASSFGFGDYIDKTRITFKPEKYWRVYEALTGEDADNKQQCYDKGFSDIEYLDVDRIMNGIDGFNIDRFEYIYKD